MTNNLINPINPVWNYDLGIKISDGKLYRIPKTHIPEGFVKVVKISSYWKFGDRLFVPRNYRKYPVTFFDSFTLTWILDNKYWSLPRWNECHF